MDHPEGIGTLADLASIEERITGQRPSRSLIFGRMKRHRDLFAPAVVGETSSGTIYDIATYLRLRESAPWGGKE